MRLMPPLPPGRADRKAGQFEADIAELRAQGYTLEAIRQALAAAGVHVSTSAVWREAKRAAKAPAALPRGGPSPRPPLQSSPRAPPERQERATSPDISAAEPDRASKEAAEAFSLRHSANPFIRAKDPS